MKILLVGAMHEEMDCIDEHILKGFAEVDRLVTGVGKVNATYSLTQALCNKEYDLVLNIGTSGGITKCEILDIFCNYHIESVDVDFTHGSFDFPQYLNFDWIAKPAIMLSNDKFLTKEYYQTLSVEESAYPILYDMETYPYAFVCDKFKTPFLSVRVVTDRPISDDSYHDFEANIKPGCSKINELLSSYSFRGGLYALLESR